MRENWPRKTRDYSRPMSDMRRYSDSNLFWLLSVGPGIFVRHVVGQRHSGGCDRRKMLYAQDFRPLRALLGGAMILP